jgi:hypothetical protein
MPVEALQVWNEQNGPKYAHDHPSEYSELVKVSDPGDQQR